MRSWNYGVEKAQKESNPSFLVQTGQSRLHWVNVLTRAYTLAVYSAFTLLFVSCGPTRQLKYFIIQHAILGFLGPIFLQTLDVTRMTKHPCSWRHGLCSFLHFSQCIAMGEHSWKLGSCLSEACQNPSMSVLTERQQSPLTTGGAVIGPTLTARAINGKQCLGPTITGHGHSSLQVNHGCEFSSARAGYCQNTFRNY